MRPRPRTQRDTVLEPRVLRPGFHGLVPSQQDWLMTPLPGEEKPRQARRRARRTASGGLTRHLAYPLAAVYGLAH